MSILKSLSADTPAVPVVIPARRAGPPHHSPSRAATSPDLEWLIGLSSRLAVHGEWNSDWARRLVDELQVRLSATRVILGLRSQTGKNFSLRASSGGGVLDLRTEFAREVQQVLNDQDGGRREASLRRAAALNQSTGAVAVPLGADRPVGVLLILGDASQLQTEEFRARFAALETPLVNSIRLWSAAERGARVSTMQRLREGVASRPLRWLAAAVAIVAAGLCIPTPHYVACDAAVEPLTRRFVNAPFEGTLEKALVEPGDIVAAGQELARMDAERLAYDRASAEAEVSEIRNRYDAALAGHQGGAAQAAGFELEQAKFKLKTLERRAEQLSLRSPIDGIVVRGDLKRSEGTTVTVGQSLFEVAPPGGMIAEAAIPEDEIAHVREEMPVTLRLDAFPTGSVTGVVARIHPRAELTDGKNVFIAEIRLNGEPADLRPGMRGRASITGDYNPLGWNLLRRPWIAFRRFAGW